MIEPSAKAKELSQIFLDSNLGGLDHRINLTKFWGITPGSRVLEIGCGQGDCTTVLADAVGPDGHVDAVDPGAPDYGAPYTLAQCQSNLLAGPLGSRINFHNTDPVAFLSTLPSSAKPYDFVVLAHCIWYFETPVILSEIISALAGHTTRLCLAEWGLRANRAETLPHVVTALLLANIEAKRLTPSTRNVRSVLSPQQIVNNVVEKGRFALVEETRGKSGDTLQDGYWEVSDLLRNRVKFLDRMKRDGVSNKEIGALVAMFDSVQAGVDIIGGNVKDVKTMDWWTGVFEGI
ncbi:hypothetical protein V499_03402 [Pseudogymnoascus sp. VKM F-103]|uniref:Methyltransferase domain-containing protein n=1 Tax=Pseudogymnoascus verrucosus TaxID=342668 RepID=A0A1B8GQ90_9PEZI|nr:uncharacterized protein VE01_04002 [Pseudogymnoascus verrucosus]KFY77144.1 hypothetical protein V499_03402 [Pseudogymnoascus sp. VKM F-103]OBT98013.2 hypothetical protein VE01_04002 [Pseudogymnoascus verrucosus]